MLAIRANEVLMIRPNMVMGYITKEIEKNAEGIKEYILDVNDLIFLISRIIRC